MPPVCSNRQRRRSLSATPKRSANPGRYHTGSTAALVTTQSPLSLRMAPSGVSRPSVMASRSSGNWMCAWVIAMLGRMS